MRTTVELPDELLTRAKIRAVSSGISLRQFFVEAVEQKLTTPARKKVRRDPPVIGSADGLPIPDLTREQIDEAMFG
jgi:hypothetical protein